MAAHAIRAGEGDVFVAAGVECVSRFGQGKSDGMPGTVNKPAHGAAMERTKARAEGGLGTWTPFDGLPDVYIAMGQTAENVAEIEGVTRDEMDEFAARSQQRAVDAQRNGFFEREITPITTPDGTVVSRRRLPARRHDRREARGPQARLPARRLGDRRQRVPAERRCGRGRRDERHPRRRARHHAARPHRVERRLRARPRDHGSRSRRREPGRARARRPHHRRHRPRRDQRGVRGAGGALGQAPRGARPRS